MLRKEKRRLSLKEAVEVEACRAVKRLQITRDSPAILPQGTDEHSWTSTSTPVDAAHQLHLQAESPVSSNAEPKPSSSVQSSLGISAKQTVSTRHGSPAAGLSRGTPQRSLSSPDMSRFKFRLTPNKPPVHPISSRTPLRHGAVLAADLQASGDSGVVFKKTSDRHSDQERLFHQLDRKLILHAPKHQQQSPTQTQRSPPFPTAISTLSLSPKAGSPRATGSASAVALRTEVPKADTCHGRQSKMPVVDRHPHAIEDDDGSTCSESCQPSTPIRGEDSPPTREQDQALAENVFAAMYEQANVLLRNLHFERLNRRATSA